jgi:hypothetical protein
LRREITGILSALVLAVSLVLVILPQGGVGAATHNEEFSESGTFNFTVPATVTKITVEAWGGGGAGGGSTDAGGGSARGGAGGGGGAYANSTLTVEPGQELQVIVGAGGIGVAGDDGNLGSPSFAGPDTNPDNALVLAAGGSGGTGNTAGGSPAGGAGGTVEDSIGQTKIAGGKGGDGDTGKNCNSGAGGNGANGGGSGGAAVTNGNSIGNNGTTPGGGGGGARTQGNGGSRAGGAGAAGKVMITWVTYDLTTSSTEGGSVTTPGEDTFTYGEEFVVDLVATPDEGYQFIEWTGNVSTIADVNAAATNITMNGDYSITAEFEEIPAVQYDLTVSSTEGGSITEPGEDTFTHGEGTVVDLVAEAAEGYQFVEWTGDVGTIADVNAAATNITIHNSYEITANFEENTPSPAGGCFIATAAYGTPMAEEIQILRDFRDKYLLTNLVGQTLVDHYYRNSPPIAKFITEHPSLKPIVRAGLMPAVAMSTVAVNANLAENIAIIGLLALVSVAVATWATRRRGRGPQYT